MKILAIETSCDETSMALVEASGGLKHPRIVSLANLVSSQIEIHRPYGGVVPNLAKREHLKNLPIVFKKLLTTHYKLLTQIKIISVTVGPGLEPCLWTGIEFAKKIHQEYFPKAKLIGVNHMEGHLYSFLLLQKTVKKSKVKSQKSKIFPAIGLIVSGGHTILILMKNLTQWKKLGETRDDAVGEAFDKVARILGLPYPGGPEIQKLSIHGRPTSIDFPRPMIHAKNYDFSFSGLKTAVLYYVRDSSNKSMKKYENMKLKNFQLKTKNSKLKADICASFQQAAIDVLVHKTVRAVKEFGAKSVVLAGGVAANKLLRDKLQETSNKEHVQFFAPAMEFNTDNAAMIGAAAYIQYCKLQITNSKIKRPQLVLRAQGNLSL